MGEEVQVRPLRREERALVTQFFDGLSAQSRQRRFLQALPRLPEALVRLLVEVDGCRHVALVAEVGGETAGIARFVALPDQTGTAEVAVTVADRFQGRGIGGLLLDALGRAAVGVGMDMLVYLVDPTNRPMLRLLRRLGVELRYATGWSRAASRSPASRRPLDGRERLPADTIASQQVPTGTHRALLHLSGEQALEQSGCSDEYLPASSRTRPHCQPSRASSFRPM